MATNTHMSILNWNAALNGLATNLNGGTVSVYTGTQPATPETALSGNTTLCTFTLPNPAFGGAAGGAITANAIAGVTLAASGTASWFRAYSSTPTAQVDGDCGTSATDMILNALFLVAGASISCTSWTVNMPVGE
jgi:hypothetical protein